MDTIENKEVKDNKSIIRDRITERYPDRSFVGQDGQDDLNALDEAIIEALKEDADRIAKYGELEEKTSLLEKLIVHSPEAGTFLATLAETGDPAAAIYKAYGEKAYSAFNEGDASAYIKEIEDANAKARLEDENLNKQKDENFQKSMETLEAFAAEKGLDQQQAIDLFMKVYGYACDAAMGIYPTELFDMALKSSRYDDDIATARREGEVAGRNAKIKENRIRRDENASMPPSLSGQGTRMPERKPGKGDENPWML